MSNLKYWLWLSQRRGLAGQNLQRVLSYFGAPEQVYFAQERDYQQIGGLSAQIIRALKEKDLTGTDRILDRCDQLGIRLLTLQDADYPEQLAAIHQPPLVLYYKGRPLGVEDCPVVAVVGTRSCTPYGVRVAGKLTMELAYAGVTIVSGMAEGIDAAAVRGTLMAGGHIISVLASGLDVVYPKVNRGLYEDVACVGTLISEYPPGTEPRGSHFPVRNRIISGLSTGVLVVESPRTGGALLTAGHALEQNRDVYAVPGTIDAPASAGTNRLIQEGAAKLVTCGEDILCELVQRFPHVLGEGRAMSPESLAQRQAHIERSYENQTSEELSPKPRQKKEVDICQSVEYIDWQDCKQKLTDDQQVVLLALQKGPMSPDGLVEAAQLPIRRVFSALTMLQLRDYVKEEKDKRFHTLVRIKME